MDQSINGCHKCGHKHSATSAFYDPHYLHTSRKSCSPSEQDQKRTREDGAPYRTNTQSLSILMFTRGVGNLTSLLTRSLISVMTDHQLHVMLEKVEMYK